MSISLVITVALVLGVVFVNGWTDAPNAIATAVSTRVLRPRAAIVMSAVFNFLGALFMTYINARVAETISNLVDFGDEAGREAGIALAAALFAIVVWAVGAWFFGIPTSESHALIAGITGSAIAMGGFSAINGSEWIKVLQGLALSSLIGFAAGFIIAKLIELCFRGVTRQRANRIFTRGQVAGAAAMSFLHGAQDGQKFMGVFMLGLIMHGIVDRAPDGSFSIPIWVILLCSLVMGLGTSVGGYRIIKSVGMDMVKLEKYQGFAADLCATGCLLFASLTGIPVSTTHTKTTAIMGVGTAKRASSVDWRVVRDMFAAWVLTFPGCGIIGFLISKLFIVVF